MGLSGDPRKRAEQMAAPAKKQVPGPSLTMFATEFGADTVEHPGLGETVLSTLWGCGSFGANIMVPLDSAEKIAGVIGELIAEHRSGLSVVEKPGLILPN